MWESNTNTFKTSHINVCYVQIFDPTDGSFIDRVLMAVVSPNSNIKYFYHPPTRRVLDHVDIVIDRRKKRIRWWYPAKRGHSHRQYIVDTEYMLLGAHHIVKESTFSMSFEEYKRRIAR